VFAANALSPAKVSQVRITDINNRQMEVIVGEDQLSLAIGKKGQNVRLATRLVGWEIKIVSEDVLKKEIAKQMGRMMASGEAVPITALQGVTTTQAELLEQKGITDVEALAAASVDDLVDHLDVSLDEAQSILTAAKAIVDARNEEVEPVEGETVSDAGNDVPAAESASDLDAVPDTASEDMDVSSEQPEIDEAVSDDGPAGEEEIEVSAETPGETNASTDDPTVPDEEEK
jgi:N utilization substance protein A